MKRLLLSLAIALTAALGAPLGAQADFGLSSFDATFTNADGTPATQAGSHPFAYTTSLATNFTGEGKDALTEGRLRDIVLSQVEGLAGDTTAYPRCSTLDFLSRTENGGGGIACPLDTVVGITANSITEPGTWVTSAVYNLAPPPGVLLRLAFNVVNSVDVFVDVGLKNSPPYNPTATSRNTSERAQIFGDITQIWGNPSDPAHDPFRGDCGLQTSHLPPGDITGFRFENQTGQTCSTLPRTKPFLTLPTNCDGAKLTSYAATSWEESGGYLPDGEPDLSDPRWVTGSAFIHDSEGNPLPFSGCGKLAFNPSITAQPTTRAASSPTGLDFSLDVKDEGLQSLGGLAASQIRKSVVTLPEGFSVNPSQAEGLAVCSREDLARETLRAAPGEGCPQASKIGSVQVESPLVSEPVGGTLYVAKPYDNQFGSLLALYIVLKSPELGVIVKQPARVEADPVTGQLTTVADEMPQLPFSHFRLHFREGTRSPLASPPACGTYNVTAQLFPWSGTDPVTSNAAFEIVSGPGAGACPAGSTPPFRPGLQAGTLNNAAGRYSPFNVRLSRTDAEQEITHFSIKLPPGIVGKLAGIPFCPDAAIAAAKARTGPHGGQEELEAPSCPVGSEVGHTLAGAGVGPSLAYAPGKLYLAGPYHGSAISLVSVTAGVVGPFDLGTVVVQLGFKINPETAEVFIDATGSDPIPHIIKGIPVHLRDIRAYADRPEFVLNPTSCARTSTASTVLGSGLDFASEADDNPVTVSTPFQAADCASLGFKPRLALRLRGGTKRGDHPALRAVLRPRAGDANSRSVSVQLPHSAFLEQGHIKTICTRVQFKEGAGNGAACPAGSVYGHARAFSPLFSEPLEGPVFLRSSEHELPDLVLALHGLIDFDAVGRIDSVDGGIRNTFDFVPDAPVSEVVVNFQGGKKGLIVNSTDLCRTKHRAIVKFAGHNGKRHNAKPVLRAKCPKARKKQHKAHRSHR